MTQRSDNFMGIGLFQFIVVDILTDKIVDILFLFQLRKLCRRSCELFHPGIHGFLVVFDLALLKKVFRDEDQIRGIREIPVFKAGHPENLRVVKAELKKNIA